MTQAEQTSRKRRTAGKRLVARLGVAMSFALGVCGMPAANAALQNGSTLNIGAGSQFEMEVSPGFFLPTAITGKNGVVLGTTQSASGSHSGAPNGSETTDIDNPWLFFGNTGMDFTSSPTNMLSASGATYNVDFSGWRVTWNGIASINMGGGAWGTNANGQAVVTCAADCGNGDTYSLYYTATVPAGDPSGFQNVHYRLTLNGTITAPVPAPTVTLSASPTSVATGESTTLTWSSTNADSCTASGAWSGAKAASSIETSEPVGPINTDSTFTLTCTGEGGPSEPQSVTVTVNPLPTVSLSANPPSVDSGGSTTLSWTNTNADSCIASSALGAWTGTWTGSEALLGSVTLTGLTNSDNYTLTCTGPGGQASDSVQVTVAGTLPPAPTVTLSANPTSVASGRPTLLNWSSTDPASTCTASSTSGVWSGSVGTTGTNVSVGPLTATETFTLECSGAGGTRSNSTMVTVYPLPTVSLSANPTAVDYNGSTTLSWTSTNADSCTAEGPWTGTKATADSETLTGLTADSTFILNCTGPGGQASDSVQVTVAAAPTPAPTVTLSANPTSVASGGSSTLTWSSTDADSCTASGAWSGTKAASGSESVGPLSAASTFTLICTGAGGDSAPQSTTVTVTSTNPGKQGSGLANGSVLLIGEGSKFEMEITPGFFLPTVVTGKNGIVLGTTQSASGSHSGEADGSENGNIDGPWLFFGNTGLDFVKDTPSNVISASGNTAVVDLRGWRVTWNGIPEINLGTGAWGDNEPGQALVTCATDCGDGDSYSLYYTATVPVGDPSGFGNVHYRLLLQGTVSVLSGAVTIQSSTGAVSPGVAASSFNGGRMRMSKDDLTAANILPDTEVIDQCVGGCFDFTVTGVTEPQVKVVLPLSIPVPKNAGYRKYNVIAQAWRGFDETQGDGVLSAPLAADTNECPAPGDAAYRKLTEGDLCVQLEITDGGPNDDDGVADGSVTDPGGVAQLTVPESTYVENRGSGGGGCTIARAPARPLDAGDWWLLAGFLTWLGIAGRRRQRALREAVRA